MKAALHYCTRMNGIYVRKKRLAEPGDKGNDELPDMEALGKTISFHEKTFKKDDLYL